MADSNLIRLTFTAFTALYSHLTNTDELSEYLKILGSVVDNGKKHGHEKKSSDMTGCEMYQLCRINFKVMIRTPNTLNPCHA
jgi:hypothetical protein